MQQQPTINKGPKACTTCAKAKARCIPGPDAASKCERCQRLKKDCFSRLPAPPRPKKVPKRSRVAELEKRLDELSSQFVEGAGTQPSHPALKHAESDETSASLPRKARTLSSSSSSAAAAAVSSGIRICGKDRNDVISFEHLFPSPRSAPSPRSETLDSSARSPNFSKEWDTSPWPLASEAEIQLLQFHDIFAPLMPFVVVPKHLTAEEIRHHRPFLWKAIMMVSFLYDGSRQLRLGHELLAEIGRVMVLDGMRSLDLLQGLLLVIGWFNYAFKSTQLTNLLFLARSICVNLTASGYTSFPNEMKYGEMEHIRAYLGVYYINTLVFTTNKKTEAFMNTSQLGNFCTILENATECPSDEYLIKLVKIQLLWQTISLTMTFESAQPATQLPLAMVVQSFQEQIDAYRSSVPPYLAGNSTLKSHIATAEVLLIDVAVSDQFCNSTILSPTDRLQLLWACVRGLRAFFDVHRAEREIGRPRFLCLSASDLAYTIIMGIKLLSIRLPGWDPKSVVSDLGLVEMIDKECFELGDLVVKRRGGRLTRAECGPSAVEDPMERLHKLLKNARDLVDLQLQKLDMAGDQVCGDDAASNREASQGWMMTDLDDDLWQNFVNDAAWAVPNGDSMVLDTV